MLRRHIKKYKHHYVLGFAISSLLVAFIFFKIVYNHVFSASNACNQLYSTSVSNTNPSAGQSFTCWVETASTTSTNANTTCAMSNDPIPLGNWYKNIWNICTFSNWTSRPDGHPAATFNCTIPPPASQFAPTSNGYEMFGVNFGSCSNSNPANLPFAKINFNGFASTVPNTPLATPNPTQSVATSIITPTHIPNNTTIPTSINIALTPVDNLIPTPISTVVPILTPTATPTTVFTTVQSVMFKTPTNTPIPVKSEQTLLTHDIAIPTPTQYIHSTYTVSYPVKTEAVPTIYSSEPTSTPLQSHPDTAITSGDKTGIQSGSTPTPPTIIPKVAYPAPSSVLNGKQTFQVYGPTGIHVDFQLQPIGTNIGSFYIGRVTVGTYPPSSPFTFDTSNMPNGTYKVFAKFSRDDGSSFMLDPIELAINNPGNASLNSSTNTIIFPSQFNPQKVPVEPIYRVEKVANTKAANHEVGLTFSGNASPNTIITLLIYSNPIVVTVKTDANGRWNYTLEQPLDPGKHAIYAVASTPKGQTVRSDVARFFIAPGFAASTNNESLILASASENQDINQFVLLTILIIGTSVLIMTVLFGLKIRKNLT